ncbi:hypothetical protein GCM10011507_31460 [Edaphobacter acidisoli]|uniref:Uncharacterized protein n=2 Tax=Edaphobacter acidisoli TaxID=2040573 RepID=A0A916S0D3_9BACT|nr:hypothetical protein GCM10011507_31460 [Edaphobacter acidisoli]
MPAQTASDVTHSGIGNPQGLRMLVDIDNTQPTLRIVLPGYPITDRTIEVVFPEHVTVREHGSNDVQHIYMWREGHQGTPPTWQRNGNSLQYEKHFDDGVEMVARATLEDDGVLFDYEFRNQSSTAFDMVWAPTDPRLTSIFHDVRLERTYVHHQTGWGLLAANTPERLSMPLSQWLPARYHDSYTWPVPAKLVTRGSDGITNYDNPIAVDEPVIATLSRDHQWVVASFSHNTGNVWSNPELTCQHVDETAPLPPGGTASLQVKLLIVKGSLQQVLNQVVAERSSLK